MTNGRHSFFQGCTVNLRTNNCFDGTSDDEYEATQKVPLLKQQKLADVVAQAAEAKAANAAEKAAADQMAAQLAQSRAKARAVIRAGYGKK